MTTSDTKNKKNFIKKLRLIPKSFIGLYLIDESCLLLEAFYCESQQCLTC